MIISSINIKKAVTSVMAFLLFLTIAITATGSEQEQDQTRSQNIYFSLAGEHGAPLHEARQNFDCEDKIYTVVELTNFELGKHKLSIIWTDPSETDRERTEYDFYVRDENELRLWGWLSLSRARGAGMLQWVNPAAGLEEFIGPWTVTVRVDDKEIERKQFEVSC